MKLKEGASLEGVSWRMWTAAIKAEPLWRKRGAELVITSGSDGKHGQNSLHYKGLALDFRIWNLGGAESDVLPELKAALGPEYDVVLEGDHFHVEYDPE